MAVYASRDLTEAELRYEVNNEIVWGPWGQRKPVSRRIELTVGMRTFVVVHADTYEEAFRTLFDTWSPDVDGERPAVEGRRQIAGADPGGGR